MVEPQVVGTVSGIAKNKQQNNNKKRQNPKQLKLLKGKPGYTYPCVNLQQTLIHRKKSTFRNQGALPPNREDLKVWL